MARARFVTPPRPEARHKWARFRVNDQEEAHVTKRAEASGYSSVSDYLRALVGLPAIRPGAPTGNQNRKKKSHH